jgi:diadenosine tetraphosphate (Ap4A) HIT family hydrolase
VFRPPDDLIVLEAEHWLVNQGVDVPIPGYLIVGARDPEATRIAALPEAAAAELGPLLVRVHRAIEAVLDPKIVYCVKWGARGGALDALPRDPRRALARGGAPA